MAAFTAGYLEVGRGWAARAEERNRELMARQYRLRRSARTPEIYFVKTFDNSRLVKAPDPAVARQMRMFCAAVAVLFSLTMIYGLQHFWAIENSYRVEAEKQTREQLREDNRELKLAEAQLSQPERIDAMSRRLGLAEPQPGQMVTGGVEGEGAAPVVARAVPPPASR